MDNNYIFVDACILLETVLVGRKKAEIAKKYIASNSIVISPLTVHLLAYFGEKDGLPLEWLLSIIARHKMTNFGEAEVRWAMTNHRGQDFEDALQVSCAVNNGARIFATFDQHLAKNYENIIDIKLL